MEIEREVLVQRIRFLGAEHESTPPINAANSLALSLSACGQKTEAKLLLRGTLAGAARAPKVRLASIHTHSVLQNLRAIGLAAE